MKKQIINTAAIFGMLAVMAGAFGAHGLKQILSSDDLNIWNKAVQYQFFHVFALLFLATLVNNGKFQTICFYCFTFGIIFFSGSLYLLSCRGVLGWGWLTIMGPITPIGGLLFIAGWLTFAIASFKNKLD